METKVVLLDLSKVGEHHAVNLDEPIIVEVLKTPGTTLVLVRDDLRRSQWRDLRTWADRTLGS